jgi:hypothetical protein
MDEGRTPRIRCGGVSVIAIPIPQAQGILAALQGVFPLFFLSGIVSLSLARLGRIRATHSPDGFQADPSRAWLLALTALGGVILVLVMLVNALFSFSSFEWLLGLLTPVWNALGTLIGWLLYGIIFLLTPLFNLASFLFGLLVHAPASQSSQNVHPGKSPLQNPQGPHTLPPELITIGRWVFLALLFLLVSSSRNCRTEPTADDDEEWDSSEFGHNGERNQQRK